ncbi:dihydrofolate reductase-like domain-containing protein [Dissophora ornata]|nr:dihydrofolate reductase-like domain-containing protein [Dissophora ornata]
MRSFSIVVAADQASGIGLRGGLPWRLRKDMVHFLSLTSKVPLHRTLGGLVAQATEDSGAMENRIQRVNACIMGRKTWESIPKKFRPLNDRFNIIISRNPQYLCGKPEECHPMVELVSSLESALDLVEYLQSLTPPTVASSLPTIQIERTFLIGGGQLYAEAVQSQECEHIFLTRVHALVECDAFFPEIMASEYMLLSSDQGKLFLEGYMQQPIEANMIEEGNFKYEYTVYRRV